MAQTESNIVAVGCGISCYMMSQPRR